MIPFDGAKTFSTFAVLAVASATLVALYGGGCWPLLSLVGLYPVLHFCNQLEARDRRDFRNQRGRKNR